MSAWGWVPKVKERDGGVKKSQASFCPFHRRRPSPLNIFIHSTAPAESGRIAWPSSDSQSRTSQSKTMLKEEEFADGMRKRIDCANRMCQRLHWARTLRLRILRMRLYVTIFHRYYILILFLTNHFLCNISFTVDF